MEIHKTQSDLQFFKQEQDGDLWYHFCRQSISGDFTGLTLNTR